jgi:hypothetical protein
VAVVPPALAAALVTDVTPAEPDGGVVVVDAGVVLTPAGVLGVEPPPPPPHAQSSAQKTKSHAGTISRTPGSTRARGILSCRAKGGSPMPVHSTPLDPFAFLERSAAIYRE